MEKRSSFRITAVPPCGETLFRSLLVAAQNDLVRIDLMIAPVGVLQDRGRLVVADGGPPLALHDEGLGQTLLLAPLEAKEAGVRDERDELLEPLAVSIRIGNDAGGLHTVITGQTLSGLHDRVADGEFRSGGVHLILRCLSRRAAAWCYGCCVTGGRRRVGEDVGRLGGDVRSGGIGACVGLAAKPTSRHGKRGNSETGGKHGNARTHGFSLCFRLRM